MNHIVQAIITNKFQPDFISDNTMDTTVTNPVVSYLKVSSMFKGTRIWPN